MADTKIGNQKSPKVVQDLLEPAPAVATPAELEEELQERAAAIAASELRVSALEAKMHAALARLERLTAGTPSAEDAAAQPAEQYDALGKLIPRFDADQPYGVVYGDPNAAYVQNGHRFSGDRRYICDEPRGTGKPFNLRLLGVVKAKAA